MMDLRDLMPNYQLHLRRTVSKSTAYSYSSRLRSFLRACPGVRRSEDFTTESVRAYLKQMADTRRPRTVRICRAALHKFGAWLVLTCRLDANPVDSIPCPRLDLARRDVPSDEAIAALLAALPRIHHPYRQALARAVVYTLVHSGMRRGELLNLCVGDVDFDDGALMVRHGKGDKARSVYPHADCMDAIAAYLSVRPACKETRLFLLRKGFPLGDQGLRVLLRDCLAVADLAGSTSLLPHSLRHALATRLFRKGADIIDVGHVLGHSSVSVTSVYLHSDTSRLKSIRDLSSVQPRSQPAPAPPPNAALPPVAEMESAPPNSPFARPTSEPADIRRDEKSSARPTPTEFIANLNRQRAARDSPA
jgi:site-specific recombinase XerD